MDHPSDGTAAVSRRRLPALRLTAPSGAMLALVLVSIAHGLSPLILRGLHSGYSWDETVYISQINPHVPASIFTPPRARGLTLLTAPASYLSSSIAVMRVWLAILSAVGMVLAFVPWLRLRKGPVVPLAAALFSTLWVTIYYSYEAIPNQYTGYAAVAAVGWLLLALRRTGRRRDYVYLTIALAFAALIRPSDTLFLIVPLIAIALISRAPIRRRLTLASLIFVGFAAGTAEWIIEAYVSYGGPVKRFQAASHENTGGLHWSLGAQFKTLGGPILCRGSCVPSSPLVDQLWWFALVPLVIIGLVAAWQSGRRLLYITVTLTAMSMAVQYLVAINYAAPRFLEPSYLLLSLPVAEGLIWLRRSLAPAIRPLAIAGFALVMVVAEVPQLHVLHQVTRASNAKWNQDAAVARFLRAHGVVGPCYVGGVNQGEISFAAACRDIPGDGADAPKLIADTNDTVVLVGGHPISPDASARSHPEQQALLGPYLADGLTVWIVPPSSAGKRARMVLPDVIHHSV